MVKHNKHLETMEREVRNGLYNMFFIEIILFKTNKISILGFNMFCTNAQVNDENSIFPVYFLTNFFTQSLMALMFRVPISV